MCIACLAVQWFVWHTAIKVKATLHMSGLSVHCVCAELCQVVVPVCGVGHDAVADPYILARQQYSVGSEAYSPLFEKQRQHARTG